MPDEKRYLCYVSEGLGATPVTFFGDGTRAQWNIHNQRVRFLPAEGAAELLRNHPPDFRPCHVASEAEDANAALHLETYRGVSAEDVPVVVVVEDEITAAALVAAKETAKAAKKAAREKE